VAVVAVLVRQEEVQLLGLRVVMAVQEQHHLYLVH